MDRQAIFVDTYDLNAKQVSSWKERWTWGGEKWARIPAVMFDGLLSYFFPSKFCVRGNSCYSSYTSTRLQMSILLWIHCELVSEWPVWIRYENAITSQLYTAWKSSSTRLLLHRKAIIGPVEVAFLYVTWIFAYVQSSVFGLLIHYIYLLVGNLMSMCADFKITMHDFRGRVGEERR